MNIFTAFANEFVFTKSTLIQFLRTLHFSSEFLDEFRDNHIYISEDLIRQHLQMIFEISKEDSFQDFTCHDNGIQFVFHPKFADCYWIRFQLTFDVKMISLVLNNREQSIQFLISNIHLKPLNYLSKPFRFCLQSRARKLVTEELERIYTEQQIPFERLFNNVQQALIYQINLINIHKLKQLTERYLLIGNRSVLDLIQIGCVQHEDRGIVLHYQMKHPPH